MAEATPLPDDETAAQETSQADRIIPGIRAEPRDALQPHLMECGSRTYLTPASPIDRPRTPPHLSVEDSRELLTRLTGLQPWQLEAFPDELPPLPVSGPTSPTRSPEHARPTSSFSDRRLSSSTAVPIRFRKPPVSPAVKQGEFAEPAKANPAAKERDAGRDAAAESATTAAPFQTSPLRSRHSKSPSKEFTTSREFRPLYLVERNRKSDEIDANLPALPSSGSPSRANSARESETEEDWASAQETEDYESAFESAAESPHLSASESATSDHAFFDPLAGLIAPSAAPGAEQVHPELRNRDVEEVTESGQATPRASDFVSPAAREHRTGPSHDALAAALERVGDRDESDERDPMASPLAASPFLDDKLMRETPSQRSDDVSPTKTSSLLQEAALGALAGGVVGAAVASGSGPKKGKKSRKNKGKGKQVEGFVPEEEVPGAQAEELAAEQAATQAPATGPTTETSRNEDYVPTFVDNEDEWQKNKPDELGADDDTLVGEPSENKAAKREEVLSATRPRTDPDLESRRSIVGDNALQIEQDILKPALEASDAKDTKPITSDVEMPTAAAAPSCLTKDDGALASAQEVETVPADDPEKKAEDTQESEVLPAVQEDEVAAPPLEIAPQTPRVVAPEATPEVSAAPEPARSSWGSGLWGAIGGWGRKKQTASPAPVAAPAVPPTAQPEAKTSVPASSAVVAASQKGETTPLAPTPPVEESEPRQVRDEAPVPVQFEPEVSVPSTSDVAREPASAPLTLDTQAPPKQDVEDGYKVLPRSYTPQTAFFTDDGRPFGFGSPVVKAEAQEEVSGEKSIVGNEAHGIAGAVRDLDVPAELAIVEKPVEERVERETKQEAAPAERTDVSSSVTSKKKKGKKAKKSSAQIPEPSIEAVPEPSAAEEAPVEQARDASPQISSTVSKQPQTSYFGDGGIPAFSFPLPASVPAETSRSTEDDVSSTNVPSHDLPADATAIQPENLAQEPSIVTTEDEAPQFIPPQTTYFGDAGLPAFSFPSITSPAISSTNDQPPEAPAPPDAPTTAAQKSHTATEVELVPSAREIVADVPGVEPAIDVHERAVGNEAEAEATPIDAEAVAPSRKKSKKGKKKKRESVLAETRDAPALDAESVASEVVPDSQLADREAASARVDEPMQAPIEGPVEGPVEAPVQVPVEAPAEDDWGYTPKKKSKKGKKTKSGVQTPEVQSEPAAVPVAEATPTIAEADVVAEPVGDRASVPLPNIEDASKPAEATSSEARDLQQDPNSVPVSEVIPTPAEADVETDAWLQGQPLDDAEVLLEKESPQDGGAATKTEIVPEESAEGKKVEGGEVTTGGATEDVVKAIEVADPPAVADTSSVLEAPAVAEEATPPTSKKDKKKKKKKGKGTDTPIEEDQTLLPESASVDESEAAEQMKEDKSGAVESSDDVDTAAEIAPAAAEERTRVKDGEMAGGVETVEPRGTSESVDVRETVHPAPEVAETHVVEPDAGAAASTGPTIEKDTTVAIEDPSPEAADEAALPTTSTKKDRKKKKGKKGKSVDEPSTPVSEIAPTVAPSEATQAATELKSRAAEEQDVEPVPVEESQHAGQTSPERALTDPVNVPLPAETAEDEVPSIEESVDTTTAQVAGPFVSADLQPTEQSKEEVEEPGSAPALAEQSADTAVTLPPAQEEPVVESKKSKKKKSKKAKTLDDEPSTPSCEESVQIQGVDAIAESTITDVEPTSEPHAEVIGEDAPAIEEPTADHSVKDQITRDILEPSFQPTSAVEAAPARPAAETTEPGPSENVQLPEPASEETATRNVVENVAENTPVAEEAKITDQEPAATDTSATDPFAGLSKKERKKLEKKLKAEAAQKETEAAPLVSEPVEDVQQAAGDALRTEVVTDVMKEAETAVPAAEPMEHSLKATDDVPPTAEVVTDVAPTTVEDPVQVVTSTAQDPLVLEPAPATEVPASTGVESIVTDQPVTKESTFAEGASVAQDVAATEEASAVDPFKGLSKTQKKKLQQKMKAEAAQKEAEGATKEATALTAPESRSASEDMTLTTDAGGSSDAAQVEPTIDGKELQSAETRAATELDDAPSAVEQTTSPATLPAQHTDTEQPAPDLSVPQEATEESRPREFAQAESTPSDAVPTDIIEATPATDPFAGLNKKQRKKLQQKLDAEAAQKAVPEAQSPTQLDTSTVDVREEPAAEAGAEGSSEQGHVGGAPATADEAVPSVRDEQSEDSTIVAGAETTIQQTSTAPDVSTANEATPGEDVPADESAMLGDKAVNEGGAAEAAAPLSEEVSAAKEGPVAQEAPTFEEVAADPFAGLSKKDRKKLEKKLKAEAEAKEKEEQARTQAPAAETLSSPFATGSEQPDVGAGGQRAAQVVADAVPEPVTAPVDADDAQEKLSVQQSDAGELVEELSTREKPSADDAFTAAALAVDLSSVEAAPATDVPTTDAPSALEFAREQTPVDETSARNVSSEAPQADALQADASPAEAQTKPIDPFKGLNKKERKKLEKKLKAEAEAKLNEDAQAVTSAPSVSAEPTSTGVKDLEQTELTAEPIQPAQTIDEDVAPEPTHAVGEAQGIVEVTATPHSATEASSLQPAIQEQSLEIPAVNTARAAPTEVPSAQSASQEATTRSDEVVLSAEKDSAEPASGPHDTAKENVGQDSTETTQTATDTEGAPAAAPDTSEAIIETVAPNVEEKAIESVDAPADAPVDPFKGLNKKERKKLEKKLKAEADAKLREDEAAAATPSVAETVASEAAEQAPAVDISAPTRGDVADLTAESVGAERVQDEAGQPALQSSSEVAGVNSVLDSVPAIDPFAGLSKTQKKKHQQKMKAEAAKKEKDEAEAALVPASTIEPVTNAEPETAERAADTTAPVEAPQQPVIGDEPADDTWPTEDLLTEDMDSSSAPIAQPSTNNEPSSGDYVAADIAPIVATEAPTVAQETPQPIDVPGPSPTEQTSSLVTEQPVLESTTEPASKKDKKKKKKSKKGEATSEPQTPIVEISEPALASVGIEAAPQDVTDEVTANKFTDVIEAPRDAQISAEEPKPVEPSQDLPSSEAVTTILAVNEVETAGQQAIPADAPDAVLQEREATEHPTLGSAGGIETPRDAAIVEEQVSGLATEQIPAALNEPVSASVDDDTPSIEQAPAEDVPALSKKEKKKAKKNKRVSIAEDSLPVTPVVEEDKRLPSEAIAETERVAAPDSKDIDEQLPSELSAVQPDLQPSSVEEPQPVAQEEATPLSKKDKKKAKKAKRGSVVETSEPATPIETPTTELNKFTFDASTGGREEPEAIAKVAPEQQAVVYPAAEDERVEASDVPQPETSETLTSNTVGQQVEGDQQPVATSRDDPIETVPDDRPPPAPLEEPEPSAPLPDQEAELGESVPLSKAQKKKAKKAKRASAVESEISQPATPAEEVPKELAPVASPTEALPTLLPATAEAPVTQLLDEETGAWSGTAPTKKDKKKDKKQQKQTATDSFLADEATRAANVSEPQPSPSPPITSETPLTFSGIPTQYPLTNTDGSVELATTSAEDAQERDVTLLDAAAEQREILKAEGEEKEQFDGGAATETVSVAQPDHALETEALVAAEPTRVTLDNKEDQPTVADTVALHEREVMPIEYVATADTKSELASEEVSDAVTSSKKKKKAKKNKRASTIDEPADKSIEEALPVETPAIEDVSEPIAKRQDDNRPVSGAEVSAPSEEVQALEPTIEAQTIDIASGQTPSVPHAAGDANRIDIAPTEALSFDTPPLGPEAPISSKEKKRAKKAKKSSGTATPASELESSVPVQALDALATPQIEEAQAILESHGQADAPLLTSDQIKQETEVIEPAVDVTDDLPEITDTTEVERDATSVAPGPATAIPELAAETPVLSKKDKKKAKKAKRQSSTATPTDGQPSDLEGVQEAIAPVGDVELEALDVREIQAASAPAVEPSSTTDSILTDKTSADADATTELQHRPAELASRFEPQQGDGHAVDVDVKAADFHPNQPGSESRSSLDATGEPEQNLAELASQLELQQEDASTAVDRDVQPLAPEEPENLDVKDAELAAPAESQLPVAQRIENVEVIESQVAPALSKKEKKKAKKAKTQPGVATPAEEVATTSAVDDVNDAVTSDAAQTVSEPVATLNSEAVSGAQDTSFELREEDSAVDSNEKRERSVDAMVTEQTQPIEASNEPTSPRIGSSEEVSVLMPEGAAEPLRPETGSQRPLEAAIVQEPDASESSAEILTAATNGPAEFPIAAAVEESLPLSKKDKKNAKKSKKASGTATPVVGLNAAGLSEKSIIPAPEATKHVNIGAENHKAQSEALATATKPETLIPHSTKESNVNVEDSSPVAAVEPLPETEQVETATAIEDVVHSTDALAPALTSQEPRELPAQSVAQESPEEPATGDTIVHPAVAAAVENEFERPVLSRKLSKKEKKARKKGAASVLDSEQEVESNAPAETKEEDFRSLAVKTIADVGERDKEAEAGEAGLERGAGGVEEPVAEAVVDTMEKPTVEPTSETVVERAVQPEIIPAPEQTAEPDTGTALDEPFSVPVTTEVNEATAEDEWAAPVKKGKKSKKDKKARKQSLATEPVDDVASMPVEVVDPMPTSAATENAMPDVEATAVGAPLPEPTPMEIDTRDTADVVPQSPSNHAIQGEAPQAADVPLPEPTPMEEVSAEAAVEMAEPLERSLGAVAEPAAQTDNAPVKIEEGVEPLEEVSALPSRKASKKSKKAKKTKEPLDGATVAEPVVEPGTTPVQLETREVTDGVIQPERNLPTESMGKTSALDPRSLSEEIGHPSRLTEAVGASEGIAEDIDVQPAAVQEPIEVPARETEAEPTHTPVEVSDEALARSSSKKDKKKKKKGKKDLTPIEDVAETAEDGAAPFEDAGPVGPPEQLDSIPTADAEIQQPASPAQLESQQAAQKNALSPSLQAVRDEAADLRQRSEALDRAVAADEREERSATPQPASMFDVVNLLGNDKKVLANTPRLVNLPEPTTPAAEPAIAVETKDQVENVVEEAVVPRETSSRKLSKKEKRKVKQTTSAANEPTEPALEYTVMLELPTDVPVDHPITGDALAVTSAAEDVSHAVETKHEVTQDPVLTPAAEFISTKTIAPEVDASVASEPAIVQPSVVSRKLSKKGKTKQVELDAATKETPAPDDGLATAREPSVTESDVPATTEKQERKEVIEPGIDAASVDVPQPDPSDSIVGPAPITTERSISTGEAPTLNVAVEEALTALPLTRKESKKDKKKSRKSKNSSDVVTEIERPATAREPSVEEPLSLPETRQREIDETPSMTGVEDLQRAARQPGASQVLNETAPVPSKVQEAEQTTTHAENIEMGTAQPSTPVKTFDTISEDVLPTLNKKGSKKHRLAALFEKQSPEQLREAERKLGHKRSGSVKNLAERFENQSRSVTPLQIVPPKSISRAASEDQLRSVSPFDNLERLRSASPRHDVDFAAAVAAGLNESGFDPSYVINNPSFYRSRSTSRQEDRDFAPDDEVATARRRASISKFGSMGRGSATPSPTKLSFVSSSPIKETAVDRTLPKGIEVPLAATEAPSFDPMDVLNDPAFARRKSPPGVLEEADPEELYALSKSKKPKGKKMRATETATPASGKDSVEQTAVQTAVLENPFTGSRAAETAAGSTARELASEAPITEPTRVLDVLEQSPKKSRDTEGGKSRDVDVDKYPEERGRTTLRNSARTPPPLQAQNHKIITDNANSDYPFPHVATTKVEEEVTRSLEEKETKKHRKSENKEESELKSPQEQHKRRAHPVSFHEDQPEEKRLHKNEAPTTAVLEPSWSFSGLDTSMTTARTAVPDPSTTHVKHTTREERQHPQGPRTPKKKSARSVTDSEEVEASPALPEFSASKGMESSPPSEFVTKERTSYLFDSSPSTRAYGTSPATAPKTPTFDSPRSIKSPSRQQQTSPTRTARQAEPYQSIFGDPGEKKDATTTPAPKRARTPGTNSLGTIVENSPDDSPLLKKGRSVSGVESAEHSGKSLRRTSHNRSFSDRMLSSPPPTTPTPADRRSAPTTNEDVSRNSPWHQANDPVDRSVALSPARRLPHATPEPVKQQLAEIRDSPGLRSQQSLSNISKLRSPESERPMSSMSMASNASTHSLRRIEKTQSGDLRAAAKLNEASAHDASRATEPNLSGVALAAGATAAFAAAAKLRGEGKGRRASMAETFVRRTSQYTVGAECTNNVQEAMGEAPRSPMSPTRPPSLRKRQSMQIMDLQTQLDQLAEHNQSLEEARLRAEETLQAQQHQRQVDEQLVQEAVEARDRQIHQRDIDIAQLKDTLQRLQEEIARLTELNNTLTEANRNLSNDANERYAQLQSEGQLVHQQWQTSQRELDTLRSQHDQLTRGMEGALREEIGAALDERNAEISRLEKELSSAREQIKSLQKQILASKKPSESFLTIRDEDYFDSACQQLCQHVQQWVLRFSKFSDTRACRLSSDIQADARLDAATREKIDKRLDNAILDGSDVDSLLADRVKRRDVFMSIVMSMIWEYVFTRYLFGMDREQRQKLKSLEKTLSEVGKYNMAPYPARVLIQSCRPPARSRPMARHNADAPLQARTLHAAARARHRSRGPRNLQHALHPPRPAAAPPATDPGLAQKRHAPRRRTQHRNAHPARGVHHAPAPAARV